MSTVIAPSPAAAPAPDPRIDRFYALLPAIYRIRDAEQGYPLQALLRVIAEQANLVEDDIARLYDNWFIETADDWAVPYIAELLGHRPAAAAGAPSLELDAEGRTLNRVLVPRREVAHLIRSRRRKGTIALLEDLARDVAGWPARALEFFKLLDRAQHLNHPHYDRLGTASMRAMQALDLVGSPFDPFAHSVDVRRTASRHTDPRRSEGRWNIPNVGVFVWRMRSHTVTRTPAYCAEDAGPHCFTFSVLGQDAPLYRRPLPEPGPQHIAEEINLPVPIRRRALEARLAQELGEGGSLAIWAEQWAGHDGSRPLPPEALIVADLSGWQYRPPRGRVAVDPVLGRLMFPPTQLPKKGVRVSYRYGFPAELGGGEYRRTIPRWSAQEAVYAPGTPGWNAQDWADRIAAEEVTAVYPVGEDLPLRRIADALRQWKKDAPARAAIELRHSGVWVEPLQIRLAPRQALQLRAADGTRPVIRLIDWQTDLPDALSVELDAGSRFALDGLLVTGRPLHVSGRRDRDMPPNDRQPAGVPECGGELLIRHSTLVPGWGIGCDCAAERPAEPSLELHQVDARVRIERSIVGSILVHRDEVHRDPLPIAIADSIVDATEGDDIAIGAGSGAVAHAILTVHRSTFFGAVEVHAVALAENSIFNDCVHVARRQIGCMRFCYVPRHCRTPRRYRCQPDGAVAAVRAQRLPPAHEQTRIESETLRVRPHYDARRYGQPQYARLTLDCADEIRRGADDGSEMGVYHHLYQPQREAGLRTRLDEYTPAGMTVGLLFAD